VKTARERASFEKVMKNLNREIEGIRGRTMKGLIRGTIIIRRAMDTGSPLIPVDTGNLRQSWFVTTLEGNKNKPVLIMGFSANYATSVHENVGAHFRRPGAGAKFFESAIKNNEKEIIAVIKKEAKVRG
jgi:hypothetical protein